MTPHFNTTQAALDIHWVRRALGYDQINIYGNSYGKRLAQELLRRAPGHVRAVILDSVIAPTIDQTAQEPRWLFGRPSNGDWRPVQRMPPAPAPIPTLKPRTTTPVSVSRGQRW
ncbi:alpha/beta fold hydrolase [Deinococcus oregonensis]|uniref:Alpha/beta fold hydrolase n=1 Tax=Deinococcus oregonensis TaxID=1805970 RepID=A0ABV6B784_9DEIO